MSFLMIRFGFPFLSLKELVRSHTVNYGSDSAPLNKTHASSPVTVWLRNSSPSLWYECEATVMKSLDYSSFQLARNEQWTNNLNFPIEEAQQSVLSETE
ncbi:hypothetical protein Trydic_g1444 [Trypoxylus dichotomus]